MTALALSGLRVGYHRSLPVLDGVDLTVGAGSLTALLGPSGCGKTTLLKAVAGLLAPDAGDVRLAGVSMLAVPAERRPVGLVFQKPLLFGHLSIGDNVAFGLRMRGMATVARRRRATQMLELVGLAGLERRRVGQLSGGQEQRVALARALVLDPQVLLLDEPFSQLDPELRARMRDLLRTVQRALGVTTVFVTHDQQEAVEVADAIALMLDGRIEAHAGPAEFYRAAPTLRAARFFGGPNEIPGTVSGDVFDGALGWLRVAAGCPPGCAVLTVRPEAVVLGCAEAGGDAPNTVVATVLDAAFRGTHQTVRLQGRGGVVLTVTASAGLALVAGDVVSAHLPPAACRVFPATADPAPVEGCSDVDPEASRAG